MLMDYGMVDYQLLFQQTKSINVDVITSSVRQIACFADKLNPGKGYFVYSVSELECRFKMSIKNNERVLLLNGKFIHDFKNNT